MSLGPDGAYEALLAEHQELEHQVDKLIKEVEWFVSVGRASGW